MLLTYIYKYSLAYCPQGIQRLQDNFRKIHSYIELEVVKYLVIPSFYFVEHKT